MTPNCLNLKEFQGICLVKNDHKGLYKAVFKSHYKMKQGSVLGYEFYQLEYYIYTLNEVGDCILLNKASEEDFNKYYLILAEEGILEK